MNILLISDFNIKHNLGGAQRSNEIIIQEGLTRHHNVVQFNYDSDINLLNNQYDITISSNLDVLSRINPYIIGYIANSNNHIRLEHDFCRYLNIEIRQYLYMSCKKTIFLTNYHYKKFIEYYGNYFINVEIVPDPIDMTKFYNMNKNRDDDILYIGFMHPLKGTNNFIHYVQNNPNKKYKVAGWGDETYESFMRNHPSIDFLGKIKYDEIADLYNSSKQMYYCPEFDEPFCRAVGEALMCGIEVIGGSTKIGSLHMMQEDPTNFSKKCHNAAKTFWEIIENV